MSNEQRVIKLEPYGPADTGMEAMQLDQADFQSELPISKYTSITRIRIWDYR